MRFPVFRGLAHGGQMMSYGITRKILWHLSGVNFTDIWSYWSQKIASKLHIWNVIKTSQGPEIWYENMYRCCTEFTSIIILLYSWIMENLQVCCNKWVQVITVKLMQYGWHFLRDFMRQCCSSFPIYVIEANQPYYSNSISMYQYF